MKNCSRREMIASVATVIAGTGIAGIASAGAETPSKARPIKKLTAADFRSMKISELSEHLFSHMDCSNFSNCHKKMREEHGVWIPELVPVFKMMDSLRSKIGK